MHRGQGHHHRGQPLVAGGHAHDTRRASAANGSIGAKYCGIVAIRQAVEHARRALGATIARVRDQPGEGYCLQTPEFLGRRLD